MDLLFLVMLTQHILLAVFWIIYVFLHSFLITPGTKASVKKSWGNKFVRYRLYYNLFSFFALVALLYYQLTIPTIRLFDPSLVVQCIGIIFSAFGVFIMIRCIKNYFFSLSGLRSLVREEGDEAGPLLITGIHQYVRHPLYLGTFLFVWSMLLVFPYLSLLIANVVITIYTLIGIELEEKKLVASFGDAYRNYQCQVPKILPRLHRKKRDSPE